MSQEFDASRIYSDPVSPEVLAKQAETIEHLMQMPNALSNARLHAQNELRRLISVCNRLAWRSVPADLRWPTEQEAAALLQRLSPEDREKLLRDSRLAAEQRLLVDGIEEAYQQCQEMMQAEQEDIALHEAEAREWAEFEAYDAAGKKARFAAWRAARAR